MKEETRKRVSEGRKKFLRDNPDKHPWKRKDKFKSKPCEALKTYLTSKGLVFVEEWQPLEDRFFSIDIAFPDIKLGIEVNGNQHYDSSGILTPYYQERHDLICSTGWTLIELHYVSCYNMGQIDQILDIREQPDYTEYFTIQSNRKVKPKGLSRTDRAKQTVIENNEKWGPFKDLVLNSGINFNKLGWVGKVALILNIPAQKTGVWMKRHLPEFYEQCYKMNRRK